jgi:hypothetical protein
MYAVAQAPPPPPAPQTDTVLCPRCGEGFGCGVTTGGCWCADVVIDNATREDLAKFYDGCLCPTCLERIESDRPAPLSVFQFLKKNLKRPRA